MTAVPLKTAARQLGKTPATVRRWIREGAPCIELGAVGRGRGSLVDPDDLLRWRNGGGRLEERELLERIAGAFLDFHKRNTGLDEPAHKTLGIPDRVAAALYVTLFEYAAFRLTGRDTELPEEIERLRSICVACK